MDSVKTPPPRLIAGDFEHAMPRIPSRSIGMVLTDPPYGIAYKTGMRKDRHHRFCREIEGDRDLSALERAAPEMMRVLMPDSAACVFMAQETLAQAERIMRSAGFEVVNRIVWDKGAHTMGDLTHAFGKRYEVLLYCAKGRPRIRGRRWPDVWRFPRVPQNRLRHQNEKPVELLERAVESLSDPGDMVLDPFMGSGSTGEACARCGRAFMGCEIDPYYYGVAEARLMG